MNSYKVRCTDNLPFSDSSMNVSLKLIITHKQFSPTSSQDGPVCDDRQSSATAIRILPITIKLSKWCKTCNDHHQQRHVPCSVMLIVSKITTTRQRLQSTSIGSLRLTAKLKQEKVGQNGSFGISMNSLFFMRLLVLQLRIHPVIWICSIQTNCI